MFHKVFIEKKGFISYDFKIDKILNTYFLFFDIFTISPIILSALTNSSYYQQTPKNNFFILEPDSTNFESIRNIKDKFKNNLLTINVTPFYSFVGALVGIGGNYSGDIFKVGESRTSQTNLALKAGCGYGGYALLSGTGAEGFGYNIMPSISYDELDFKNHTFSKTIFSLGLSYRQLKYYPYQKVVPINSNDIKSYDLVEGFTPSFNFQKVFFYPESGFFVGCSFGYVNALNVFSIDIGYRF